MNQKSFWTYTSISLGSLLIVFGAWSGFASEQAPNPAYPEYQQATQQRLELQAEKDQWMTQQESLRPIREGYRRFEEALAGTRSIEEFPTAQREALQRLRSVLAGKSEEDLRWLQRVTQVKEAPFQSQDMLSFSLLGSSDPLADQRIAAVFLKDPARSVKLFQGNVAVIPSAENDPMPLVFQQLDVPWPPAPPKSLWLPLHLLQQRVWWEQWVWLSGIFTLVFTVIGLIFHANNDYRDPPEKAWSHPLSLPVFAIGWIGYAIAAPGFLLFHLFRLANLNFVSRFRAWQRKRRLRGMGFDELFNTALETLNDLRAEVAQTGGSKELKSIDKVMEEVRASRNAEHMLRVAEVVSNFKTESRDRQEALNELNAYLHQDETTTLTAVR